MNKFAKTLLVSTLSMVGLIGSSMAQTTTTTTVTVNTAVAGACAPAQEEQYRALAVAVIADKADTVKSLLAKFCYNFDFYKQGDNLAPFYFAHNLEMLKIFEDKKLDLFSFQEKSTGLDYFSYVLISHANVHEFSDKERKSFLAIIKKYDPTVTEKSFSSAMTPEDRNKTLAYLGDLYKKSYIQKKDIYNNTALSYAIQTGEYSLISDSLGSYSSSAPLFRKNKEGIAPIHLMFAINYIATKDENLKKKMIEKTNDEVIKLVDRSRVGLAGVKDMSFFDYAEMMKDENPDFYNKLKAKFNFSVKANPKTFEQYKKNFTDTMKYPQRMKSLSDDK